MFEAVMITLLVSMTGPPEKISESYYTTMDECLRHKRQKEITEFARYGKMPVFFCEGKPTFA